LLVFVDVFFVEVPVVVELLGSVDESVGNVGCCIEGLKLGKLKKLVKLMVA